MNMYILINFRPTPLLDTKYTIGALVYGEHPDRARVIIRRTPCPHLTDARASRASRALLRSLIVDLVNSTTLVRVMSMSPHILVGVGRQIPSDVPDPVTWVERHILNSNR